MKIAFLTVLMVIFRKDGRAVVTAPFIVEVDHRMFTVPIGFVTDFASVPKIPLICTLLGDIGHQAAVLHDWLYTTNMVPRCEADAIFRYALIRQGIPAWKAWAMWAGVRVFGASHYG